MGISDYLKKRFIPRKSFDDIHSEAEKQNEKYISDELAKKSNESIDSNQDAESGARLDFMSKIQATKDLEKSLLDLDNLNYAEEMRLLKEKQDIEDDLPLGSEDRQVFLDINQKRYNDEMFQLNEKRRREQEVDINDPDRVNKLNAINDKYKRELSSIAQSYENNKNTIVALYEARKRVQDAAANAFNRKR